MLSSQKGSPDDRNSELSEAITSRDAAAVVRLIRARDFMLVKNEAESDSEGTAAMTAEVDDEPMLVAFSGEKQATEFADSMVDEMGEEGFNAFLVSGESLLEYLPQGFGILLDPETDQCCIIDVELLTTAS